MNRIIALQLVMVALGVLGLLLFVFPKKFYDLNKPDHWGVRFLWFKHFTKYYFDKKTSAMAIQEFRIVGGVMVAMVLALLILGNMSGGIFNK